MRGAVILLVKKGSTPAIHAVEEVAGVGFLLNQVALMGSCILVERGRTYSGPPHGVGPVAGQGRHGAGAGQRVHVTGMPAGPHCQVFCARELADGVRFSDAARLSPPSASAPRSGRDVRPAACLPNWVPGWRFSR